MVVTRPFKGAGPDYYSFEPSAVVVPYISAVGSGPELAYHKAKGPNTLSVLPAQGSKAGACLCEGKAIPFGQAKGSLKYTAVASDKSDVGSGTVGFGNNCAPQPRTDLLAQKNPTCDVRTYVGGQTACHHMWSLLDEDQAARSSPTPTLHPLGHAIVPLVNPGAPQEIPWPNQPLEYHQKFRFYYQPFNASYHHPLKRTTWGIASPVEYDVPKCGKGVMGCEQKARMNT